MGWVISVPVWGKWYTERFFESALPSHCAALAGQSVRYIIHTDRPRAMAEQMKGFDVEFRPVPKAVDPHLSFSKAAREAFDVARMGDMVALLTADIAVSRETFTACEARFRQGKKIVMCAGTRTLAPEPPPVGMSASDLLSWTMRWPHPITRECFWGEGHCAIPWAIYFRNGDDITLRGFHLHPIGVLKDREVKWTGSPDADLIDNYSEAEIHVVTGYELAMAELSHVERALPNHAEVFTSNDVVTWAAKGASKRHRWLARHRIVIQGNGDTEDRPVMDEVLSLLEL